MCITNVTCVPDLKNNNYYFSFKKYIEDPLGVFENVKADIS